MIETIGMDQAIRCRQALGTDVAPVKEALRIASDLHDPISLGGHQKAAAAMVHPGAMGFYPAKLVRHD